MVVAVRAKSQITLPSKTVKKLGIKEGDEYEVVEKEGGGILLVPVVTYPKEYIDMLEREAEETMDKVKKGEWPAFENAEDMINYLRALQDA